MEEQLQIGGYDDQSQQQQQNQISVHQSLASLDGRRQLPLQPVPEFERDVVMQGRNNAEQNLNVQVECNIRLLMSNQDKVNMLAFDPQQSMKVFPLG